MHTDRYELTLSLCSAGAATAYREGVDRLLSANPGADTSFQNAIAEAPDFALAHIGLARAHATRGDMSAAREAAARARDLAGRATGREQSHVAAIALGIEGKSAEALAATRRHIDEHPRDAMVLAPAVGVFGLLGFSGLIDREQQLFDWLSRLAPHYGEDWWFLGAHGFAAIETGHLEQGRALVERSMARNPRSANAAHIKLHAHYEANEDAAALAFIEAWLPDYSREGPMHCHLAWHGALAALALGRFERAEAIYADAVHPGAAWGPPLLALTDSASYLWRATLSGRGADAQRWREISAYGRRWFPAVGMAFANIHHALACAVAGETEDAHKLADALAQAHAAGRLPPGEVAPTLARALIAAVERDWATAADLLERSRSDAVRLGGSRAQRDIVELTLREAYSKLQQHEQAQALAPASLGRALR